MSNGWELWWCPNSVGRIQSVGYRDNASNKTMTATVPVRTAQSNGTNPILVAANDASNKNAPPIPATAIFVILGRHRFALSCSLAMRPF